MSSAKKPTTTPRKRGPKATPKKTKGENGDDDEDSSFDNTPTKKGTLNKVKGGRVTKPAGHRRVTSNVNYNEEDDEAEGENGLSVKSEPMDNISDEFQVHEGNGNGYGNGHNAFGDDNDMDDYGVEDEHEVYVDAEDEA